MLELFQYRFFVSALMAAFFTSLICGIVGTYITSKRLVFISGGISHASFGGIGLGHYLGVQPILSALFFSVVTALGIKQLSGRSRVREDSAIGIFWSFGTAVGILFISLTPGYAPNLMSYLFGSILTVSRFDLFLLFIVAVVVLIGFTAGYRWILYTAFDEQYAKISGLPVLGITYFLMILIAVTIVVNIRIVGIILVMSLLTIPQSTASELVKDFKWIMLLSVLFALLACVGGLFLSYYLNIPSGASIVLLAVCIFGLVKGIKAVVKRSVQ